MPRLNPGRASGEREDAGCYPHHRTHLQRCTSRTGHSAGRSDAQAAREQFARLPAGTALAPLSGSHLESALHRARFSSPILNKDHCQVERDVRRSPNPEVRALKCVRARLRNAALSFRPREAGGGGPSCEARWWKGRGPQRNSFDECETMSQTPPPSCFAWSPSPVCTAEEERLNAA
jgi:hypothetical protein